MIGCVWWYLLQVLFQILRKTPTRRGHSSSEHWRRASCLKPGPGGVRLTTQPQYPDQTKPKGGPEPRAENHCQGQKMSLSNSIWRINPRMVMTGRRLAVEHNPKNSLRTQDFNCSRKTAKNLKEGREFPKVPNYVISMGKNNLSL